MLGDVAILTCGQPISEEVGVKLENVTLGRARKVVVTVRSASVRLDCGGAPACGRVESQADNLEESSTGRARELSRWV
jgi:chaperonin GroEL